MRPMVETPVTDAPVPERRRLELSFVRARWLTAIAIAVLTPIGGLHLAIAVAALCVLAAGNLVISDRNRRVATLTAQRRLGVAAVSLDALVVLGLALLAPSASVNFVYGALFVVVTETAMRYAPLKAMAGAVLLVAGLALTMAARSILAQDAFDLQLLAVLGALVLLAGTMIGSVVREIYRQGVAPATAPGAGTVLPGATAVDEANVPEDALALLTARERQVMSLIAQGYSNAQIASALVVEQKTVKNHINNIYSKLRLNSRYEAITHALGQRQSVQTAHPAHGKDDIH
ncbi:MAG: helix-turn-helix transcriptional regulator [Dehalococcoidia bacterium]